MPRRFTRAVRVAEIAGAIAAVVVLAILFVPRLSLTSLVMKLPVMPRADDIVAVESAFTQRTTDMITDP